MWILAILLILGVICIGIFKFLPKNRSKNEPINTIEKKEQNPIDIKINSNKEETVKIDRKPLKRPLSARQSIQTNNVDIKPEEEKKDNPVEKQITAKNEVLDLDDLFKTISLTTDEDDFDFGLRVKDDNVKN